MIIGITGGSGCGKTTLLNCIAEKGGLILDCDAIYHRLLQTDKDLLLSIENRFPGVVENGVLQRKALGNIVFADQKALSDLNRITHAAVKKEVLHLLENTPKLAAIDAIGLFENMPASGSPPSVPMPNFRQSAAIPWKMMEILVHSAQNVLLF